MFDTKWRRIVALCFGVANFDRSLVGPSAILAGAARGGCDRARGHRVVFVFCRDDHFARHLLSRRGSTPITSLAPSAATCWPESPGQSVFLGRNARSRIIRHFRQHGRSAQARSIQALSFGLLQLRHAHLLRRQQAESGGVNRVHFYVSRNHFWSVLHGGCRRPIGRCDCRRRSPGDRVATNDSRRCACGTPLAKYSASFPSCLPPRKSSASSTNLIPSSVSRTSAITRPKSSAKPRVTHCPNLEAGLPSAEVDRRVRETLASMGTLQPRRAVVRRLAPDIILTRRLCDACRRFWLGGRVRRNFAWSSSSRELRAHLP